MKKLLELLGSSNDGINLFVEEYFSSKQSGADGISAAPEKRTKENQRLYLHEVYLTEKLEEVFKTTTEGAPRPVSKLIIAKKARDCNPIGYA